MIDSAGTRSAWTAYQIASCVANEASLSNGKRKTASTIAAAASASAISVAYCSSLPREELLGRDDDRRRQARAVELLA